MIEINFIRSKRRISRKKQWFFVVLMVVLLVFVINLFFAHLEKSCEMKFEMSKQQPNGVILNHTPSGELRLRGVLIRDQERWALLSGKKGIIARAKVGDKISKKAMIVKKIMPRFVELFLGTDRRNIKIYFS